MLAETTSYEIHLSSLHEPHLPSFRRIPLIENLPQLLLLNWCDACREDDVPFDDEISLALD